MKQRGRYSIWLNSTPFLQVWQEFWITGDCNGRGVPPSDPNWPLDHDLFLTCAYDTVKLLRNHASLALWCGGNEQIPSDDINEALTRRLALVPANENPSHSLDGTRLYLEGKRILHVLSVSIGVIFLLKSNNTDQLKQAGLIWLLFYDWIPVFEWCVVRYSSKNSHQKYICLKEVGQCVQNLLSILVAIVNIFWGTYIMIWKGESSLW